ncbi:SRPBCC family protein [Nocardia aurantia]|uniref:Polyketide cyclase n=1 Tax=Nocardia aurantia TaxID=2585199 RepID=A0A7K0DYM3_9NOCA|nr:SRPBCC family protein [Nocardia aurantia]MQY29964.1 hypothetical protein [Nocardia aurantia]
MTIAPTLHLDVAIARPFPEVAAYLADPRNFPSWATGLSSGLEPAGPDSGAEPGEWLAVAPQGRAFVRFSPANDLGVADHRVRFPDGTHVDIPLRAIPNGTGTTVVLTLFRQPDMDDERFATDADWVRRDLTTLRNALER